MVEISLQVLQLSNLLQSPPGEIVKNANKEFRILSPFNLSIFSISFC